ncbi:glycosyltransferase family 2 protein [Patescibacteria group bacterium]
MPKISLKSKKPLVSIVIITKNQKKFLEKSLPSIFKQTYQNFEVIVVDSGSTDGALKLMNKFSVNIIHTNQPNPKTFNHAKAFNQGAKIAKGKYLVRLSGDAIPANRRWLEELIKSAEEENVAMVCGRYFFSWKTDLIFQYWFRKSLFHSLQKQPYAITGGNCLMRKNFWENYPLNEKFGPGDDWEWAQVMKTKGYKIIFNQKAIVFHEHSFEIKKQLKNFWWWITTMPKGLIRLIEIKKTYGSK